MLEDYVERYYGFPLEAIGQLQAFYGGEVDGCLDWLASYVDAGARHIVIRVGQLAGHLRELERFGELASRARERFSAPDASRAVA